MADSSRNKNKNRKHNRHDSKYVTKHKHYNDYSDAKTPPLPVKLTGTMQDLMKQRETIRKELKKMQTPPNLYQDKTIKLGHATENSKDIYLKPKESHSKRKTTNISQNLKKSTDINLKTRESHSKRKINNESENYKQHRNTRKKIKHDNVIINVNTPESSGDNLSLHSDEDEETIIEQIRKKRKQLIEKLSNSKEDNANCNENTLTANASKTASENDNNNLQNDSSSNKNIKRGITDMFAENDDFKILDKSIITNQSSIDSKKSTYSLTDNWDDPEGYYIVSIGETLNNKYTIKRVLGQGVFSNVLSAQDKTQGNIDVAIKILRSNDLMYKTGLKEISILKEINEADPQSKYHCIRFMTNFMHRGHLCMVLESMFIDLRCVLKKYGKHRGLNMKAIHSYTTQLLLSLKLLKKVGIIHCDIKPDNILVNEKKNLLKLCDFGSAMKVEENEPTPYLVSRFYRAPEIILGLRYGHGVDLWSSACTIYELATGKIMFTGSSNNKMLKCFMDVKGKIPNKLIRKGKFKDQHFNSNYNFLLHKSDEVTGKEKVVEIPSVSAKRNLMGELKHAFKELEERKLTHLKALLDKMIMLDPNQRPSVAECLKHPFIRDEVQI